MANHRGVVAFLVPTFEGFTLALAAAFGLWHVDLTPSGGFAVALPVITVILTAIPLGLACLAMTFGRLFNGVDRGTYRQLDRAGEPSRHQPRPGRRRRPGQGRR
jgi:hypothetical protein